MRRAFGQLLQIISDRACGGLAQQVHELGEDLLNRVQLRRAVGREEELGASDANELAYGFAF
jgi:hypothetical protein